MRVANGVLILSVLTIFSWKCGQANATPGFWDSGVKEPVFDTEKVFSNGVRNQFLEVKSVFPNSKEEFNKKQSANDLEQDHAGHSTKQPEDHVPDYNQQRQSSPYDQKPITCDSSSLPQQVHNYKSVNQGDDFVQNVDQLIVFDASKNLQKPHVDGQTKRREDSSVTPSGHPDDCRQQTDQLSRPYGQSSYDRQNGQDVYPNYNRQQVNYAPTERQPVNGRQRVNQPSRPYGQSSYGIRNGQGVYNPYNRQPGSYVPTGTQPVNDRQGVNQPSGSYGQSSYGTQNGQGVYPNYNRQPGNYVPTERQPVNDRQGVNQPSGSYGQSSYGIRNGQGVYNPYNRQPGSYAPTGTQPVNGRQGVNQPSGSYGQSSYGTQNGQGVYNPYNRQPGSYAPTGTQPVNDRQGVNQPSGSYGQSSYGTQNGQGVYNPYNRQQENYAPSDRPFANDGNTEQVNPNNDQSKNTGDNYNKDWDVYSSVPLTDVSSSGGHTKLAGTVKLPGGVSSVSIEKSPNSLDTSSVIKYGNLAPKGAVIISTNQEIGS